MDYETFREDVIVTMLADVGAIEIHPTFHNGASNFRMDTKNWPTPWDSALGRFMDRWTLMRVWALYSATQSKNGSITETLKIFNSLACYQRYLQGETNAE